MADENTLKSLTALSELDENTDLLHIYDISADEDKKTTVAGLIEKSSIYSDVSDIKAVIPSSATSSNQLIDISTANENYQSKLTSDEQSAIDSGITAEKVTKLDGIEAGAEINVQADWDQTDESADDYIKNKPSGLSVVDVVEDGNMNAVTSNAVNDTLAEYAKTDFSNASVPYVTEIGSNTNGYYKKWSNGLIEQWGNYATTQNATISFPIAFSDTNYAIIATAYGVDGSSASSSYAYSGISSKSTESFYVYAGAHSSGRSWYAIGY